MTHRIRIALLAACTALVALASPSIALAQTKLIGTVADPGTITLRTEAGADVTDVPAGTYTIEVRDQSINHNFHLSGPGVDQRTEVETITTQTWTVTLQDRARYTFVCDPHNAVMRGSFTTGGGPPTPPPASYHQAADTDGDRRSGSHDLASYQSWRTRDAAEGRPLPHRRPRPLEDAQLPSVRAGCQQTHDGPLSRLDDLDRDLPEGADVPLRL